MLTLQLPNNSIVRIFHVATKRLNTPTIPMVATLDAGTGRVFVLVIGSA